MIRREDVYRIGTIGKPHGVKGELSVHIDDDIFDRVDADYLIFDVEGILVPFFIEEYSFRSNTKVLMSFDGINSVERAREYVGCDIYFPRNMADNDKELSWASIVEFNIVDNKSKETIGVVNRIDDSTENVLFEVTTTEGKELLLPASPELIVDIDEKQHTIVMDIPEGLLEL